MCAVNPKKVKALFENEKQRFKLVVFHVDVMVLDCGGVLLDSVG
jgi:hypothetical protein